MSRFHVLVQQPDLIVPIGTSWNCFQFHHLCINSEITEMPKPTHSSFEKKRRGPQVEHGTGDPKT